MKHTPYLLITLLGLFVCPSLARAYDFAVGGVFYSITSVADRTVAVTFETTAKNNNCYSGDVVVPATVEHDSTTYRVTSVSNSAFSASVGLTSISLPESVTAIGSCAFQNCTGLTSFTIPSGVTYIENSMFNGCSGLTSITIPEGVTEIDSDVFAKCSGLTSLTIPASVTELGHDVFYKCTNLRTLVIEDAAETLRLGIGLSSERHGLFYDCPLDSVYIGRNLSYSTASVADTPFAFHRTLSTVVMGDSVTKVGKYEFRSCSNLTNITLPAGLGSIGESALHSCTALEHIEVPDSVTSIGYAAFYGCTGLKSFAIPRGVTTIEQSTFYGCTSLTSIVIPDHVTKVGVDAFSDCTGLQCIVVGRGVSLLPAIFYPATPRTMYFLCDTPPTLGLYNFGKGVNDIATVYVPLGARSAYLELHGWYVTFEPETVKEIDYAVADGEPWLLDDVVTVADSEAVIVPHDLRAAGGVANERVLATGVATAICLPYSLTSGPDIRFYELADVAGTILVFSEVEATEPLRPYLAVRQTDGGSLSTAAPTVLKATMDFDGAGVEAGHYVMRGTLDALRGDEAQGKYVLTDAGSWELVAEADAVIPAGSAYLESTGSEAQPVLKTRLVSFIKDTAIEGIRTTDVCDRERMRQLYDLTGRRIASPSRGICVDAMGRRVVVQ